jgi:hypothetical protein
VNGDKLLTLADVAELAYEGQGNLEGFFFLQKPAAAAYLGSQLDLWPGDARQLASFFVENPSAPDAAGIIHLQLKRCVPPSVSQSDPLMLWRIRVFRAVLTGGLEFMKAEQAAVAALQATPAQDRLPMSGGLANEPDPMPYAPSGFAPDA